jgi:transposase
MCGWLGWTFINGRWWWCACGSLCRTARCARKRGAKRAIVAVARSLLVVIYHLLKYPEKDFHDLGADYYAKLEPARTQRSLVKRLEKLGYHVTLVPKTAA